jgi:hypothetical protein
VPAKGASAKAAPAKPAPGKAAGQPAAKGTPAPGKGTPSKAAPSKAAPPDEEREPTTTPLWVDDSDAAPPEGQETKRRGLRRFGRRPGSDDTGA